MIRNFLSLVTALLLLSCNTEKSVRMINKIDSDWLFYLGEVPEANGSAIDDSQWRKIDLPHDWSIEHIPDSTNPSGVAGGFTMGGIGYYRKKIMIPDDYKNKSIFIKFDGIYKNSTIWINEKCIGKQQYGYVSFYFDITKHLILGKENTITVRVDNSFQPADRWYSGSGIYRHVWLEVVDPVHVPVWGTYITCTNVTDKRATVAVETEVNNTLDQEQVIVLLSEIFGTDGTKIAVQKKELAIQASASLKVSQEFEIQNPNRWDVYQPNIYKVKTTILKSGKAIDEYDTDFGIRTVEFSSEKGFLLNGKQIKLKGVNLHHDGGCLGAAVPAAVWEYRLDALIKLGVNAIRTSHNPAMEELITLCDKKGILVFNEINDKWAIPWLYWQGQSDTVFINQHKKDFLDHYINNLSLFVDRDKNHPSVIIWSIGNETLEQLIAVEEGRVIVQNMVSWLHKNEPTRKVTCGMHPGNEKEHEVPTSLLHEFDVLSYNYRTHQFKDWKKKYPELICIASETKQYNNWFGEDNHCLYTIDFSKNSWWHVNDDFICGQFIWAGIDYLGESAGWPDKGLRGSILYSNAEPKANAFFTQSIYDEKPMVRITVFDKEKAAHLRNAATWQKSWWPAPISSHWNWQQSDSTKLEVVVFSNCETVELLLNDQSLGEKNSEEGNKNIFKWNVQFKEGILKAIAKNKDVKQAEHELVTAGTPAVVALYPSKAVLSADNDDAVVIVAKVLDKNGNLCPLATNFIRFESSGPCKWLGVDNGDMADHYQWKGKEVKVQNGVATCIIQSDGNKGSIKIKGLSDNLRSVETEIRCN